MPDTEPHRRETSDNQRPDGRGRVPRNFDSAFPARNYLSPLLPPGGAEGIRLADGRYVCELTDGVDFVDAFGHKQLTGTANYLARRLAQEIGCKTRTIELSSMQRAASHLASRIDILEAFQVGGAAVKAADEGDTGEMVIIKRLSDDPYQSTTDLRNVHKVSNVEKVVPREWITEDGTYVTDEFISYVRPLIQGDVSPVMVDGIPRYLYHKKK